jgi:alpha-tubulin suppressor-like RCC1 family protein
VPESENVKKILIAIFAVALGSCEDSPTGPPELAITVVSGAEQTGGFGGGLAAPIVVRVTDLAGNPVAGERVTWHVVAGGGITDSTATTTDASGNAQARWRLGGDAGAQLLVATARNASISVRATGTFQFASVSVGFRHQCALSTSGEAYCWGLNSSAQLGDGTQTSRLVPTPVIGGKKFISISAGWGHTCGVSAAGQIFCWGDNREGQLGLGTSVSMSHAPAQVPASFAFSQVSTGFVHTCAVTVAQAAYCWGSNGAGQLGSATATGSTRPVAVTSESKFRSIDVGENHSCAVTADGQVFCWGSNSTGELGIGAAFGTTRNIPARAGTLTGMTSIAAGARHTCAAGASVFCWGRNAFGETGLPPLAHIGVPSQVTTSQTFTMLTAGNVITCGGNTSGVYCWGGDAARSSLTPEARFTGAVSSLDAGFEDVCYVSAGDVYCFGAVSREPVKIVRPE